MSEENNKKYNFPVVAYTKYMVKKKVLSILVVVKLNEI